MNNHKSVVWGVAAGHGTTASAARGAFTWREYTGEIPRNDWLEILTISYI